MNAIPTEPDAVLAIIEGQNSLGLSRWREVIYHNGEKWCAFDGSDTFEDGEQVVDWIYAAIALPYKGPQSSEKNQRVINYLSFKKCGILAEEGASVGCSSKWRVSSSG